jgi:hypothetical protein
MMTDMNLYSVINGAATKVSHSALPDSPVIPDRPPGRLRVRAAHVLRSVAATLDGEITLLSTAKTPIAAGPSIRR